MESKATLCRLGEVMTSQVVLLPVWGSLTEGGEEDVPRAWWRHGRAGLREQVAPRLGRLPLGHVGQRRPGLGLRHPREGRRGLKARIFNSVSVAARESEPKVISAALGFAPLPSPPALFLCSLPIPGLPTAGPSSLSLQEGRSGPERKGHGLLSPTCPERRTPARPWGLTICPQPCQDTRAQKHFQDISLKNLGTSFPLVMESIALGLSVPTAGLELKGGVPLTLFPLRNGTTSKDSSNLRLAGSLAGLPWTSLENHPFQTPQGAGTRPVPECGSFLSMPSMPGLKASFCPGAPAHIPLSTPL